MNRSMVRDIRKQVSVPNNGQAYYLGFLDFTTATLRIERPVEDARQYFSRNIATRRNNMSTLSLQEEQVQ
jgi:hypothetical protein